MSWFAIKRRERLRTKRQDLTELAQYYRELAARLSAESQALSPDAPAERWSRLRHRINAAAHSARTCEMRIAEITKELECLTKSTGTASPASSSSPA